MQFENTTVIMKIKSFLFILSLVSLFACRDTAGHQHGHSHEAEGAHVHDAKLYLHFLGAYFKSLLLSNKEMSSLPSLKPELFPHLSKDLEIILAAEGELKLGIQPALILEHALRYIAEDIRDGTN